MKLIYRFSLTQINYRKGYGRCFSCKYIKGIETIFKGTGYRNQCVKNEYVYQMNFTCMKWKAANEVKKL